MGTRIDDRHSGTQNLSEQLVFPFAKFSIKIQRQANIMIIAEEQHCAVFAALKPHRRTFKDGPCVHSTPPDIAPPTASIAASLLIRAQVYNWAAPRPKQICRHGGVRRPF